jgi:hypothetical protein
MIPVRLTYSRHGSWTVSGGIPLASSRLVGEAADIYDQRQISKLLSRLERLGLLANTGEGRQSKGEPNARTLTSHAHAPAGRA